MKLMKIILFVFLMLCSIVSDFGQDSSIAPQRTPEQEAAKQTEKLQQELNLSQEQAKQVYEINLKYARERQISNTRSEAMERMKNKNADIQRVLNDEQNMRLQSKRYERSRITSYNVCYTKLLRFRIQRILEIEEWPSRNRTELQFRVSQPLYCQ